MTHTHLDHIGCLAEIQKQLPWAELWMHQLEADLLEQGDERAVYGMDMFRGFCEVSSSALNQGRLNLRSIGNSKGERP